MKKNTMGSLLLLLLIVSLTSCLTITTGLDHSASGAGRLSLDYRINKKAAGVQKDSITSQNLIPLPIKRSDFDELTALNPSVSVRSYSETEDSEYIYINAELDYQNIIDLSEFLGFSIESENNGDVSSMTMHILDGTEPIDQESLNLLDSLFSEDRLVFDLTFPRNIRSSTYGSVSGRTVLFDISIPDVFRRNNLVWSVEW
ncbi:hypothetical protein EXM22_06845 [Oceanispirochaeta crateris]|uniref:Lipoprotein n=1 Tax=Oceanispirochaeta crateris TaxID=2518645 RepID=A0A5C1QKJ6_9SPIO|nr:hypothetical protein [Oceanispirochaeta crateris]QEN07719.1 hypothetical protein EXM22_06845 [Oceanispirochaeta crateris]